jgi:probable HAF family extracellular repeat protein
MRWTFVQALAAALAALPALAAPIYTITDLGILPGNSASYGLGLNSLGQIAGYSSTPAGDRAFYWNGVNMVDVGVLPAGTTSYGYAINTAGHVVGYGATPNGDRAFFWNGTTMTGIGTFAAGDHSYATAINESGQVAGYFRTTGGDHAFLWNGTTMIDLGTLPGDDSSEAYGINHAGYVTGYSRRLGVERAFLWNGTTMIDLGALPGWTSSVGTSVNDLGHVVGLAETPGGLRAFLWNGMTLIDLGATGVAEDVNAFDHVVGQTTLGAFFYDGVMHDLNTLALDPGNLWNLMHAADINDAGQITGVGLVGGELHAYLLTPVNTIPEPSTWLLSALGLGVTLSRRLGRRLRHWAESTPFFRHEDRIRRVVEQVLDAGDAVGSYRQTVQQGRNVLGGLVLHSADRVRVEQRCLGGVVQVGLSQPTLFLHSPPPALFLFRRAFKESQPQLHGAISGTLSRDPSRIVPGRDPSAGGRTTHS